MYCIILYKYNMYCIYIICVVYIYNMCCISSVQLVEKLRSVESELSERPKEAQVSEMFSLIENEFKRYAVSCYAYITLPNCIDLLYSIIIIYYVLLL